MKTRIAITLLIGLISFASVGNSFTPDLAQSEKNSAYDDVGIIKADAIDVAFIVNDLVKDLPITFDSVRREVKEINGIDLFVPVSFDDGIGITHYRRGDRDNLYNQLRITYKLERKANRVFLPDKC